MKRKLLLGLVLVGALCLAACVSEKTMLRNADGQVVRCQNLGIGWLGAPLAMIQHAQCVKSAKAAGYSEFPTQSTAASQ